ncbi:hypothetical protein GIB67_011296, partial [Kingdonia uniflora]
YTINEKVPSTASNRRKRALAREEDLLTYKRKRKTIDPSTVVPPNTVDSANEGVCEGMNIPTESAEGEGATSNDDAGPSDKSLLRSFKFHRARSIVLGQEKLLIRVHHHQSTWDLRKEPQVVQDFVKLKGLDRIGAISYSYYSSALISTFIECWQPETNTFYFKWGEMNPTMDDVEQLVGLPEDGNAKVIGGTWGFLAILKVFENNLLQDFKDFKSLKVGVAGNSVSLKKLKSHYAYKLEKALSNGTAAAAKKKKGLIVRWQRSDHGDQQFWHTCITIWVQYLEMMRDNSHAIPRYSSLGYLHISQSLVGSPRRWTPMHTSIVLVGNGTYLLRIDMVVQLCSILGRHWTTTNLRITICLITVDLAANDSRIHQRKPFSVNEHGDTPVHQSEDITEQYDASTSECDLLKETIEQMKAEIELKREVDEQCILEFANLPRQLDLKVRYWSTQIWRKKNTSLEAELRQKSGLEDCNQSLSVELNKKLAVLQSHQPVPDTILEKNYENLLAAHEDIKKKLIVKQDFKVWRQALMKALASEGIGDMGDPTFEELFKQNERFVTIAQQGPKEIIKKTWFPRR